MIRPLDVCARSCKKEASYRQRLRVEGDWSARAARCLSMIIAFMFDKLLGSGVGQN